MANDKETSGNQVTAQGQTFGPAEGETAAEAYPDAASAVSRDAKDYVLVTKYVPEADGLRIEEQVPKRALEDEDSEYHGLSTDDDNVVEAHPAANRPTSDLRADEREEEERLLPGQDEPGQTEAEKEE